MTLHKSRREEMRCWTSSSSEQAAVETGTLWLLHVEPSTHICVLFHTLLTISTNWEMFCALFPVQRTHLIQCIKYLAVHHTLQLPLLSESTSEEEAAAFLWASSNSCLMAPMSITCSRLRMHSAYWRSEGRRQRKSFKCDTHARTHTHTHAHTHTHTHTRACAHTHTHTNKECTNY